jgi:hypothetical protein
VRVRRVLEKLLWPGQREYRQRTDEAARGAERDRWDGLVGAARGRGRGAACRSSW